MDDLADQTVISIPADSDELTRDRADIDLPPNILDALSELYWLERGLGQPRFRAE